MSIKKGLFVVAVAAAVLATIPAVATAASKPTGRSCQGSYYYDGQGIQRYGYRCAEAEVIYASSSSVLWQINYYRILYTVSAGMSYGPHNNENPAQINSGFHSGQQSGLSPDSGITNSWISRTYWGTSRTYKGQTVFHINAYPDIPDVSDPRLGIATARW